EHHDGIEGPAAGVAFPLFGSKPHHSLDLGAKTLKGNDQVERLERIALRADRLQTFVQIVEPKLTHGFPPLGAVAASQRPGKNGCSSDCILNGEVDAHPAESGTWRGPNLRCTGIRVGAMSLAGLRLQSAASPLPSLRFRRPKSGLQAWLSGP